MKTTCESIFQVFVRDFSFGNMNQNTTTKKNIKLNKNINDIRTDKMRMLFDYILDSSFWILAVLSINYFVTPIGKPVIYKIDQAVELNSNTKLQRQLNFHFHCECNRN